MSEINKKLSETLIRAGCLEGIIAEHGEDEIAVRCGHFDDYLLVTYLGQLLELGELDIIKEKTGYAPILLLDDITTTGNSLP